MLVDVLPSREATAELRDYLEGGGREVDFLLGDVVQPGAVIEQTRRHPYRVEVRGSALLAARADVVRQRGLFLGRDVTPALTYTGAIDWDQRRVRGAVATAMDLSKRRWSTVAQVDLWHLALILHGAPATSR